MQNELSPPPLVILGTGQKGHTEYVPFQGTGVYDGVAIVMVVVVVLVEPVSSLEHGFSMYLNTVTRLPWPKPV